MPLESTSATHWLSALPAHEEPEPWIRAYDGAALAKASWEDLEQAVERATRTSSLTVEHFGAYAPTRSELD